MMKLRILVFGLVLGSCAVPQSGDERQGPPVEVEGTVAGSGQRCIMLIQLTSLRVSESDPHTLIYGSGKTLWANHIGECSFRHDDLLVTQPTGSQLCEGDIVRSIDRNSKIPGPSCVLGEFVPYKR